MLAQGIGSRVPAFSGAPRVLMPWAISSAGPSWLGWGVAAALALSLPRLPTLAALSFMEHFLVVELYVIYSPLFAFWLPEFYPPPKKKKGMMESFGSVAADGVNSPSRANTLQYCEKLHRALDMWHESSQPPNRRK